jgi:competence protein ComGC
MILILISILILILILILAHNAGSLSDRSEGSCSSASGLREGVRDRLSNRRVRLKGRVGLTMMMMMMMMMIIMIIIIILNDRICRTTNSADR